MIRTIVMLGITCSLVSAQMEWEQVTDSAAWEPRWQLPTVTFLNHIWVLGGRSSDGGHLCDVWRSTDGGNWVRCRDATWDARGGHTAAVRADTLWVMGGNTGGLQFENDVYYTTDGDSWVLATAHAGWCD